MRVIRPILLTTRAAIAAAVPLTALVLGVALRRGDREGAWLCVRTLALAAVGWSLSGQNLETDRLRHGEGDDRRAHVVP